jgi:hypothetical protein
MNDVIVNNQPSLLAADPTDQMHALTINDHNNPLQPVILPLILRGVTSLLNVRNVTIDDFSSQEYPRLHLISETLNWDPTTTLHKEQETAMMDYYGKLIHDAAMRGPPKTLIINALQSLTTDLADVTQDGNIHQVLTSHIVISTVDASLTGNVRTCKTAPINFKTIAAQWMVSLERAQQTVQRTTQWGVCTSLNPMLAQ